MEGEKRIIGIKTYSRCYNIYDIVQSEVNKLTSMKIMPFSVTLGLFSSER